MRALLRADRGSGFPVLYVPGIDGTGELLLGTASRLEEHFRLLRLAYRADDFPREDTYEALARTIAEVCEERQLGRCLVLAESFGGAVALQLALDYPDLVQGLMIINSFARFPKRAQLAFSRQVAPLVPRALFNLGRRALAPRSLFGRRREAAPLRAFRELPGAFFDEGYRRRLAMIAGLDLRPRLIEIKQPLALFASEFDRVVPSHQTMAEIAEMIPQATLEPVLGGGHLILPLASEPWTERLAELQARK
ncbi:MAG: pimeloyl-ACP methyl ester carboxylesterase [Candidatus Paceibacteria bacterium]